MARPETAAPLKSAAAPTLVAEREAPARTWDWVLAKLDQHMGDTDLPKLARERQAAGQSADAFADALIEAVELRERSEKLDQVFALSRGDDWNMEQPAIELALERIRAGDDAPTAYAAAKAMRGGLADQQRAAWDAAYAAYEAAEAAADEAGEERHTAWTAAHSEVPIPDALRFWVVGADGRRYRSWHSTEASINERIPPFPEANHQRRLALKKVLRDYERAQANAQAKHKTDALAVKHKAAIERRDAARFALLRTPAPDLDAVLKAMVVLGKILFSNCDYVESDPEVGEVLADPTRREAAYLNLFGHLKRLNGQGPEHAAFLEQARAAYAVDEARADAMCAADDVELARGVDQDGFCARDFRDALVDEGVTFHAISAQEVRIEWPSFLSDRLKVLQEEGRADPSKFGAVRHLVWREAATERADKRAVLDTVNGGVRYVAAG